MLEITANAVENLIFIILNLRRASVFGTLRPRSRAHPPLSEAITIAPTNYTSVGAVKRHSREPGEGGHHGMIRMRRLP